MDKISAWRANAIDLAAERPFRVGGALINPVSHEVEIGRRRERLQPQILKVLVALVRRKPEVVSRVELADICWDGRIIGEDVINHSISVLRSLAQRAGGFAIETVPKAGYRLVETQRGFRAYWTREKVGLAATAAVAAALLPFVSKPASTTRTIIIQPAHETVVDEAVAQDLLVRLATFQAVNRATVVLKRADARVPDDSDLVFEVAASGEAHDVRQSLALLDGQDRAALWSKSFDRGSGTTADLRLRVSYTAARVLECALEGKSPDQSRLDQATLKLYLNGCARLAESFGAGAAGVIPIFAEVVKRAPGFRPGWAKLMLADGSLLAQSSPEMDGAVGPNETMARRHLHEARKLHPNMAEATLLESEFLPLHAYEDALRLTEKAKKQDPDNPVVLSYRSAALRTVGRMRESIRDAKRAAELDPLSPWVRGLYVLALAYGDRVEAANRELRTLERLWPGTGIVQETAFRFHLRFGDPHTALRMAKSLNIGGQNQERFLVARATPTADNITQAIDNAHPEEPRVVYLGFMTQALGEFGRTNDLFELLNRWPEEEEVRGLGDVYFRPALNSLRRDPRFMKIAARAGLLSYWRSSGIWPDFCFDPNLPYDCEVAARAVS